MKKTASVAILERLAAEGRRVLSDWRAMLLLRRATFELHPSERRWSSLPRFVEDVHPLLRQMRRRDEIAPLPQLPHLYEVTVPYARTRPVEEDEILMEAHPYAALSHLSALTFHGLADEFPKRIIAIVPTDGTGGLLPLGTDGSDWEGLPLVGGFLPARILGRPVQRVRVTPALYFGIREYRPLGYPVRVTTPERTLLDGLRNPDLCGGLDAVLHAWLLARDTLDLDALVNQVQRFDVGVLRQRVGFILDELRLVHPILETWRTSSQRGGSSKLLGSSPYAPTYSERWNLSINAPVAALQEG